MEKSMYKFFFSRIKEVEWLNTMGSKGYLLTEINDSKYFFEKNEENEDKYYYSIEYLEGSPQSDSSVEYYKSREGLGVKPLISAGNWVYFVRQNEPINVSDDTYKGNSLVYLRRTIYLLFFALCGAILTGYHIYAAKFIEGIGLAGDGRITKKLARVDSGDFFDKVLNGLKNIVNFIFKMINNYFDFWTDIFGKNEAVAVLSVVIPVTLILIVIAAFNIDEYLKQRCLFKKSGVVSDEEININSNEEGNDAEQAV